MKSIVTLDLASLLGKCKLSVKTFLFPTNSKNHSVSPKKQIWFANNVFIYLVIDNWIK